MGTLAVKEELAQALNGALANARKVVVLGIGNELRYGDHLGILAAREIEKLDISKRYQIFSAGTTPENFTGAIRGSFPSHVVLIDAADMGKAPGTIEIIDESGLSSIPLSTHNIPLSFLVSYLTQEINCKVVVLGIQPETNSSNKESPSEESIKELALFLCQQ